MSLRGQSSVEFLLTYGLAFLALLVTLGALSYLDVFNLGSVRSNECAFPAGTDCLDFALSGAWAAGDAGLIHPLVTPSSDRPYLRLILYNSYGVNLTLVNASLTAEQFTNVVGCAKLPSAGGVDWPSGTNITLWCEFPQAYFHPTQYYHGDVELVFRQKGGTYNHTTRGVYAVTADGSAPWSGDPH